MRDLLDPAVAAVCIAVARAVRADVGGDLGAAVKGFKEAVKTDDQNEQASISQDNSDAVEGEKASQKDNA